jgi:DNA sulfur modification protein DndE
MKLSRLRLTKDASNRLRFLAGKTGLTPNLLCRIGFCLSLGEPSIPDPDAYPEEEREFNRYTLLGEYDALFIALLRERCREDDISADRLPVYFRAHMNRGVLLLQQRTRSIADIALLIPASPTGPLTNSAPTTVIKV